MAAPGAAAGKPAICSTSFDPYLVPGAVREACGIKSFPLKHKLVRPDGSKEYIYVVQGHRVEWRYPGPGFDPATATPTELRYFRLPPKPPAAKPRMRRLWQHMVRRLHFVHPPARLTQSTVRSHPAEPARGTFAEHVRAGLPNDVLLSYNWSGAAALGNFNTASSEWVEPAAKATSCPGNSAAFWSGLGGVNTTRLAQNGTFINVPGAAQHQAWWEILPAASVYIPLQGHAGWPFFAGTWRRPTGFTFEWYDDYSGGYVGLDVSSNSFDGSTADFIAERPEVSGRRTPLTNFGTVLWDNAWVADNGLPKNLSTVRTNVDAAVMFNDATTKVTAVPYAGIDAAHTVGGSGGVVNLPASRGGFNDLWKNCN